MCKWWRKGWIKCEGAGWQLRYLRESNQPIQRACHSHVMFYSGKSSEWGQELEKMKSQWGGRESDGPDRFLEGLRIWLNHLQSFCMVLNRDITRFLLHLERIFLTCWVGIFCNRTKKIESERPSGRLIFFSFRAKTTAVVAVKMWVSKA